MNKKKIKEILLIVGAIVVAFIITFFTKGNIKHVDTITYKGNTYVYLEYSSDIFTYNFNSNSYYEEDLIHPVSHEKWDMLYFNGDLFIRDKEAQRAIKYYQNDKNYEWYISFDVEEDEIKESISLSNKEIKFIYNMEYMKKDEMIPFDKIEKFASIIKRSKDDTVFGLVSLAYYNNNWYYKTEVMDDDKENYEYVIKLPKSLNDKISKLVN